jgi:hypothetical protein
MRNWTYTSDVPIPTFRKLQGNIYHYTAITFVLSLLVNESTLPIPPQPFNLSPIFLSPLFLFFDRWKNQDTNNQCQSRIVFMLYRRQAY